MIISACYVQRNVKCMSVCSTYNNGQGGDNKFSS